MIDITNALETVWLQAERGVYDQSTKIGVVRVPGGLNNGSYTMGEVVLYINQPESEDRVTVQRPMTPEQIAEVRAGRAELHKLCVTTGVHKGYLEEIRLQKTS